MWVFSSFRLLLKLPSRFDGTAVSFKERQRLSLSVREIGLIILNEYWSDLYFLSSYFVHRRKIYHLYVTGYMYIWLHVYIHHIEDWVNFVQSQEKHKSYILRYWIQNYFSIKNCMALSFMHKYNTMIYIHQRHDNISVISKHLKHLKTIMPVMI